VRVDVVQEGPLGPEAEGHGQAAAEWFDQPPVGVRAPQRLENRDLPALAAGPFQRRHERRRRRGTAGIRREHRGWHLPEIIARRRSRGTEARARAGFVAIAERAAGRMREARRDRR
jgi:hypothetical protein